MQKIIDLILTNEFVTLILPFGLLPGLLLEWRFPLGERRRRVDANFVLDFVMPLTHFVFAIAGATLFLGLVEDGFERWVPALHTEALDGRSLWIQVPVVILVADFLSYLSHYLRHRVPALWWLHESHHSQPDLNPMTEYRAHLLEGIFDRLLRLTPLALIGVDAQVFIVWVVIDEIWGGVIHANVRLDLRRLHPFFVTPQFHRIHHSTDPAHFDRNYSFRFSIWDHLFGTAYLPERDEYPAVGLDNWEFPVGARPTPRRIAADWWRLFVYPFRQGRARIAPARA